jgi:HEPN domain-containing protein
MNNTREAVSGWLKKADNDIIAARQILLLEEAPLDTVCFHAQQAVEKAMKALLTQRGVEFPKTLINGKLEVVV